MERSTMWASALALTLLAVPVALAQTVGVLPGTPEVYPPSEIMCAIFDGSGNLLQQVKGCLAANDLYVLTVYNEHAHKDSRYPGRQYADVSNQPGCPSSYTSDTNFPSGWNDVVSSVDQYACSNVVLYEHATTDSRFPGSSILCNPTIAGADCLNLQDRSFNDMASAYKFKA